MPSKANFFPLIGQTGRFSSAFIQSKNSPDPQGAGKPHSSEAIAAGLGLIFGAALLVMAGVLVQEHRIAATKDLGKINAAFFTANAVVGAVFLLAILLEVSFPMI